MSVYISIIPYRYTVIIIQSTIVIIVMKKIIIVYNTIRTTAKITLANASV